MSQSHTAFWEAAYLLVTGLDPPDQALGGHLTLGFCAEERACRWSAKRKDRGSSHGGTQPNTEEVAPLPPHHARRRKTPTLASRACTCATMPRRSNCMSEEFVKKWWTQWGDFELQSLKRGRKVVPCHLKPAPR